MKILSWNINELKSIINKNFVQIIKELNEDILFTRNKITRPIKVLSLKDTTIIIIIFQKD